MDPEGLVPMIIALLVLLSIASVIAAAVYVVLRMRSEGGLSLPLRFLFRVYLYLALLASLMVVAAGLSYLGQAALSVPLGREFSYSAKYYPAPARPLPEEKSPDASLTPEEQGEGRRLGLERAFQEGLLQGASLTVIGGIIWGVHLWARRRLETEGEEQEASLLSRIYPLVLLLVFSIITITSLPGAVFETLRYYLLGTEDAFNPPPGGKLATALVALPFWLFYLRSTLRTLHRSTTE